MPSQKTVWENMPESFKTLYPKTRAIIDCFEIKIQKSKSLKAQAETYSSYKNANTVKILAGIIPTGQFCFMSKAYGGRISDREITVKSGFVNILDKGDDVMADRGFEISDILLPLEITLNKPPSTNRGKPLARADVDHTRRIASLRIHVERAIGRLRNFKILQEVLPLTVAKQVDNIIMVIAALCNMHSQLVRK